MLETYQVNNYSFETYQELNDNLLYIDYINRNYEFNNLTINPNVAYRYQGNLFGLFREMNVEPHLYVYTMYLNGYTNPVEYRGDRYSLKLAIRPKIPQN